MEQTQQCNGSVGLCGLIMTDALDEGQWSRGAVQWDLEGWVGHR